MPRRSSAPTSIPPRGSVRQSSAIALLFAAAVAVQGCTPRCQETCSKVLDCGLESTRVARDECIFACREQGNLYNTWEDQTKIDAFKAHKRCIGQSSCEEIEQGVCYDPELFIIEGPGSSDNG